MSRRPRSSQVKVDHYSPTEMTMTTLRKMEERGFRATRRLEPGSESYIHDSTSPYYSWLLPGWLAEERVVESGRTYRYYYDPAGQQYRTKYEVLDQWEKLGIVVIED